MNERVNHKNYHDTQWFGTLWKSHKSFQMSYMTSGVSEWAVRSKWMNKRWDLGANEQAVEQMADFKRFWITVRCIICAPVLADPRRKAGIQLPFRTRELRVPTNPPPDVQRIDDAIHLPIWNTSLFFYFPFASFHEKKLTIQYLVLSNALPWITTVKIIMIFMLRIRIHFGAF